LEQIRLEETIGKPNVLELGSAYRLDREDIPSSLISLLEIR